MAKPIDLTDLVFGRLTVERIVAPSNKRRNWLCGCSCGKTVVVRGSALTTGNTRSCGCFRDDQILASSVTHGASRSDSKDYRLYTTWCSIKRRCKNESDRCYHLYGGRGIKMHQEWFDSYEAFATHVGPRPSPKHSLDRINNEIGYVPGNVRWATSIEQANNTRKNTRLTHNGKTLTIADWGRELGISSRTISTRLGRGWSIGMALSLFDHRGDRTRSSL